ncbi:MAG: hypothetical protein GY759_16305 [Chloroflexi bacterium]|nr:hypothetical protein [Chloroflexota bacterium]
MPELDIGEGAEVEHGMLYRLRKDRHFIHTAPAAEEGAMAAITRLIGPQSADLLSRLCGLDFDSYQFPDRNARQSSVAKTRQHILHHDMGDLLAYSLIGARSLGAYLWDTISMAGRELGILPAGAEALAAIEQH